MLRFFFILGLFGQSIGKYLNMEVMAGKKECLYLYKKYGDWLTIEIRSNDDFDLSFSGPNESHILTKQRVRNHKAIRQTNSDGDYGFCFYNSYNFHSSISVYFDYDYEIDSSGNLLSHEEKTLRKITSEKEKILTLVMEKIGIRNNSMNQQIFLDSLKMETENIIENKNNISSYIERTFTLLSLHADQMETHLKYYKSRRIRHFHLQEANNFNVMLFSIIICFMIIISGLVQVVVIKSIFGISIVTWKFWRY
ncbi:transmembrane emp24 domain-containing protein 5 isoform X1 [Hydra vulgaris]|uniref:transmembrane emp24 domain-containing protein 5 isoform X1 n=1 Tax=Hydra vulgaris TaxID=6087 RepID=UPI001F5EB67D|nr:transmembrane emp24 domain-containing protein 5 [Hydra vulgaris]